MAGAKTTKKQRKFGKNLKWCLMYKNTNRREKNKARRIRHHLKRFPADKPAIAVLASLVVVKK